MRPPRSKEFTEIALGTLSALYNAAVRMTGDEHEAHDLVQDTYEKVFERSAQLRNLGSLKLWMFRIMRNRFISLRRQGNARPELVVLEGGIEAVPLTPEAAISVERAAIARLSREAIRQAVSHLPEDLQSALVMCDMEGFSYQEISEAMDCPVGTVRSRIARARARLMKSLAPQAAALGIGQGHQR